MNNMANMANMANMGAMGGPPGAPVPMMNNSGPMQHQAGPRQVQASDQHRSLLHTHIYDYFLRSGMYDCARALLQQDPHLNVKDGHARDENGNPIGNGLGDDPMDTDSKDNVDQKRPDDLPLPNMPGGLAGTAFLYEWFCLFWDMFNSSKGKGTVPQINQYVSHTQQQSRARMGEQQQMLRNIRPEALGQQQYAHQMMRGMPNGAMMNMKQTNPLQRAAVANAQNPQAMQMLQQQKREQPGMDGTRPASPGSTDNAPSPSKRPRLEGAPFNPAQGMVMPNGRPSQGMPGQQQAFVTNSNLAKNNIAAYSANLQQHHGNQMPNKPMANVGGPQPQGSPMVQQGPDGNAISQFYNPGDLAPGAAMRSGPNAQATGSNHALQDYQMQLMLLEQQNKKRLMMARQEQDIGGQGGMQRADGPGGPAGPGGPGVPNGPGGQNFQGTSPPGGRNGASPNPTDQMKRASQQMGNAANMGSPLPDGAQSRSSPNAMNFIGGNMDPNGGPHFAMNMNIPGQMNGGMRPPGSHPGQFNGQISQQMMAAAQAQQRQAQQQGGPGAPGMQWSQNGPNGQMAGQGPQPPQGTPQQRAMPPPSAPAAAAVAAGSRNTTSSPQTSAAAPPTPQQGNKANPKKKDTKNAKSKAAAQKKTGAGVTTGATPAAEGDGAPEPPTPATPITPVNPAGGFTKPQGVNSGQVVTNGQPAAAAPPPVAPVQTSALNDQNRANSYIDTTANIDFTNMDFADPMSSTNVLTDFDFDSFLHDGNNGEDGGFNFDANFMEGGEIGAE